MRSAPGRVGSSSLTRFGEPKILLSTTHAESRIADPPHDRERIRLMPPVFRFGPHPYMVVSATGGSLDARRYTTSDLRSDLRSPDSVRASATTSANSVNGDRRRLTTAPCASTSPTPATDRARVRGGVPRAAPPPRADAETCAAHPVPEDFFAIQRASTPRVPHGESPGLLQQEDLWAIPRRTSTAASASGSPTTRSCGCPAKRRRVHPPDALQPEPPRQHDRVAGRALRPGAVRPAHLYNFPKQKERLRPASSTCAHRPGPRHIGSSFSLWNQRGRR